jgi:putative mRNA 3-end processing factor
MDSGTIMLNKKPVKIHAPVSYYDMSAHAGMQELHDYVKRSNPNTVICIHGDKQNTNALAESLKLEGYKTHAPKLDDVIKID